MSRRKPIREFPTAAWKITFAPSELRYTSHGCLEARRPRGINVSEGKDLLLFAEVNHSLFYFDIHGASGILPVTNSIINFNTIFLKTKYIFLIFTIMYYSQLNFDKFN